MTATLETTAPARRSHAPLLWLAGLIVLGGLLVGYNYMRFYSEMMEKNRQLAPIKEAPGFTMQNQEGATINPGSLLGHVWIADFIFTRCPGPCLQLTKRMAQLQQELPADVKFVSFSVDPEYDTPAVLKKYGIANGADFSRWTFLTADKPQMEHVVMKGFMTLMAEQTNLEQAATEGPIIHSMLFALVDQKGRIRKYYNGLNEDAIKELKSAVEYLKSSYAKE